MITIERTDYAFAAVDASIEEWAAIKAIVRYCVNHYWATELHYLIPGPEERRPQKVESLSEAMEHVWGEPPSVSPIPRATACPASTRTSMRILPARFIHSMSMAFLMTTRSRMRHGIAGQESGAYMTRFPGSSNCMPGKPTRLATLMPSIRCVYICACRRCFPLRERMSATLPCCTT